MLRLAFQGLRGRKGPFAGAFVALAVAAALVMACGVAAPGRPPVARRRSSATPAAAIVLTGDQKARINVGTQNEDSVSLYERARVDAALAQRASRRRRRPRRDRRPLDARADLHRARRRRRPRRPPDGRPRWDSAVLTPYALSAGHAPAGPRDLVVDAGLADRGHLRVGDRVRLAADRPGAHDDDRRHRRDAATVDQQGVMFVTAELSEHLAGHRAAPTRSASCSTAAPTATPSRARLRTRAARRRQRRHRLARAARSSTSRSLEARDGVIAIGGTFGGLAILIAMFVVSSTLGLVGRSSASARSRCCAPSPRRRSRSAA